MSIWDLREAIESAIPAWVELVAVVLAVAFLVYAYFRQRRRSRRR